MVECSPVCYAGALGSFQPDFAPRKNTSVGIQCVNYLVLGVNEKRVVIILYLNRGDMTTHKAAEAVYNSTVTRDILWLNKLQGGPW